MKYVIHADGACAVSKCLGGYAAIVHYDLGRVVVHGAKKNATNNEMELLAVVSALRQICASAKKADEVEIYTDSAYIVNAINKGWYKYWVTHGYTTKSDGKPIRNKKLWVELLHYISEYQVVFIWVKGHAGNKLNEVCDRYATTEVKYLKQKEEEVCSVL